MIKVKGMESKSPYWMKQHLASMEIAHMDSQLSSPLYLFLFSNPKISISCLFPWLDSQPSWKITVWATAEEKMPSLWRHLIH